MQIHLSPRNVRLTGAIYASEVDGDLYAAIDKVSDKLAGQLRKRKTRRVDDRRTSSRKESR
jgi:ribosomal subunit interface protein